MQTVYLTTTDGPKAVQAEIIGAFCIHQWHERDVYRVSHLFTGLAMGIMSTSDSIVRQRCEELMQMSCDWYFSGASYHDFARAVRPIVHPWMVANGYASEGAGPEYFV